MSRYKLKGVGVVMVVWQFIVIASLASAQVTDDPDPVPTTCPVGQVCSIQDGPDGVDPLGVEQTPWGGVPLWSEPAPLEPLPSIWPQWATTCTDDVYGPLNSCDTCAYSLSDCYACVNYKQRHGLVTSAGAGTEMTMCRNKFPW
jgi:hypothetical protein